VSNYPPQPTLPAEVALTDAEYNFQQEEPPRFFPQNQDSNWGLKRKNFSDQVQMLIEQLDVIYAERWPMTSTTFLDEWEKLVGLPQNPTSRTIAERRNSILARLRGGPWTRSMRQEIVEGYLSVLAFGDPIELLPPGVGFDASGLPLYDEPGTVAAMYRIYEDRERFAYKVKIDSSHSPDIASMTRDLQHSQYAGLTLVVDTTTPSPYDYIWDTYEIEPNAFWPLTETSGTVATDFYTHAQNGTYTGTFTLNSTALLVNDSTRKSASFNGGYVSVPDSSYLDLGDFLSIGLWFKRVTVDGTDQYLISKGTGAYGIRIRGSDNKIVLSKVGTGDIAASTTAVSDTTTSHYLVVQKNGSTVEIWLDGVNVTGTITNPTLTNNAVALNIGREVSGANLPFKGIIGYVSFNNRTISSSEITRRYNTGKDINRGTVIPFVY
jgi:Concanavalin A-like lectin/glucanases superfamily